MDAAGTRGQATEGIGQKDDGHRAEPGTEPRLQDGACNCHEGVLQFLSR